MQTILHHPLFIPLAVTIAVIAIFPLMAGYIVLVERKVLADFQVRQGLALVVQDEQRDRGRHRNRDGSALLARAFFIDGAQDMECG